MNAMNKTKEILVYADWYMYDVPRLVGTLSFSALRGKAVYAFEYEKEWLKITKEIMKTYKKLEKLPAGSLRFIWF